MNNAVYGKTLENMRNRTKMMLVNDGEKLLKYVRNPEFYSCSVLKDELAIVTNRVKIVKLTPLFLGAAVLDKSKHHMFQFRYDHTTKVYGEDMRIRYTDTDSFHIKYNMSREELYVCIKSKRKQQ